MEFGLAMDWMTKESHLKAVFPLTASNRVATYNWDLGTIERPTNFDRQFEVASHQWVDLTDQTGSFGVTVLTDCKNASDKPDDNTLRLTLVRTPGVQGGYPDQGTQDLGHHEFCVRNRRPRRRLPQKPDRLAGFPSQSAARCVREPEA